ncbi:MAG: hypothetical protein MUF04_02515, partial [Akkermansiaceae bacterium]|nr:hypothetical protein [Akkermansiaceae bacterium]
MKSTMTKTLLAVLLGAGMSPGILLAQNPGHNPGDLLLFFQKRGVSSTSIIVSLGNAASLYRGSAAGPTADRQAVDIININSQLTTAFGAGWASDPDVFAGLIGCFSSSTGTQVFDGDQTRTLYASRSRAGVGIPGAANSAAWDFTLSGASTTGATHAIAFANTFETNYTTQVAVSPMSLSKVDVYNPFLDVSLGIQGTAFNAFPGGVQQRGAATTFNAFGPVANPEFLLDLYRISPREDSETVDEVSGPRRLGTYEGTIVINSSGGVSFISTLIPAYVDMDGDGLSDFLETLLNSPEYGFDPNVSQPERVAAFMRSQGFYTQDTIQDLVTAGQVMIQATGANVNLEL